MSGKTIAATALAVLLAPYGAFAQTGSRDNGIHSDRYLDRLVPGYTNPARTNPENTNGH